MNLLPTILQALGIATIAFGVSLIFVPAGLIIAGSGILLFGLAWERKNK
jgi:uncharacterized membrane protein